MVRTVRFTDFQIVKTVEAVFERAQGLLHRFFKAAAHGHRFADGFHRCRENALRSFEFVEVEAGNFDNDIIDGRFERGGCLAACDVIAEFIERVSDGQLRGNLCYRGNP